MRVPTALAALSLLAGPGCDALSEATPPNFTGARIQDYTLSSIPVARPDGSTWDVDGAPDPYVVVSTRSTGIVFIGRTHEDAVPEREPIRWSVRGAWVDMGDDVMVDVYDDDVASDDHIASFRLSLSDLRADQYPETINMLDSDGRSAGELQVEWMAAE